MFFFFIFFSYFRDLLFKPDSYLLEEHSFAHLLVISKENFVIYGASMHSLINEFLTFIPNSRLFLEDLFLKFESDELEKLFFVHSLVVIRKKLTHFDWSTYFLKEIILPFFHLNRDFKRLFFIFTVLQGLVFKIWCLPTWRTYFCASSGGNQKKFQLLFWEHAFFEKKKSFFT